MPVGRHTRRLTVNLPADIADGLTRRAALEHRTAGS